VEAGGVVLRVVVEVVNVGEKEIDCDNGCKEGDKDVDNELNEDSPIVGEKDEDSE